MSDYSNLVDRLRATNPVTPTFDRFQAARAIDALTARVAQLEACLTDTVQQLELGGVKE